MRKYLMIPLVLFVIGGEMRGKEKICLTTEEFTQLREIIIKDGTPEKIDEHERVGHTLQEYQLSYRKHREMEIINVSSKEGPFFWLILSKNKLSHSSKSYPKELSHKMQSKIAHHRCELEKILRIKK